MRVLVVDDDVTLGNAIVRGPREQSMEVLLSASADEARELLLFATHDVVVLDVLLPGGSGFDLCRLMRDRGIATPVLMLTARDAVADRVHGLDAGADDYLTKPFAFEELVARVRALARRSTLIVPEVVRIADLDTTHHPRGAPHRPHGEGVRAPRALRPKSRRGAEPQRDHERRVG